MKIKTVLRAISKKDLTEKRMNELKDENTDPMRKAEISVSSIMSIISIIAFIYILIRNFL